MTPDPHALRDRVRDYWDAFLHDQDMSAAEPGTEAWFRDLADYRYTKLAYLPRVVPFDGDSGHDLLEVGCGIGLDLERFARGGARAVGIDLAPRALGLARRHLERSGFHAELAQMDGEHLAFADATFDVVYCHGVLPYTPDPQRMVAEIHRVLRPGGTAIVMGYHRDSWLAWVSRLTRVPLEHAGAPVFRTFSRREFQELLTAFRNARLVTERFPVPTRLHGGWKAKLYDRGFVRGFNALPRRWTRTTGFHLIAWAEK